jgi:hypothetical protein
MAETFQVDKFHFNNHLGRDFIGDHYSGFCLEDQTKALCILFDEEHLSKDQVEELQRINLILAQQENDNVLRPLAWGKHDGRHYAVYPDFGRPLSSYENLKPLPPAELLMILRRLLRALCFADAKQVSSHQALRPATVAVSLTTSDVKLGFFGYPLVDVATRVREQGDSDGLLEYFPPVELSALVLAPQHYDLYALGLIALELVTAQPADEVLGVEERLDAALLRERIGQYGHLPLPVQVLLYKLLTLVLDERYLLSALDDVVQLAGRSSRAQPPDVHSRHADQRPVQAGPRSRPRPRQPGLPRGGPARRGGRALHRQAVRPARQPADGGGVPYALQAAGDGQARPPAGGL